MCSNMIPCPLCSQPAFVNSDSLRLALVSVATRHLTCPVCSELLLGLDKLTIHMFGHLHGLLQEKLSPSTTIFSQNNETNNNNSSSLVLSSTQTNLNNNNSLISNYLLTTNTSQSKPTNCILPKAQNYVICDNNLLTTNILTPITTIQTSNTNFVTNSNCNNNISNSTTTTIKLTNNSVDKTTLSTNHKSKTKVTTTPVLYPCDICAFKFNDKKILEMHKNLVHSKVEFHKNGQAVLPCHLCSKKFRMRGSLMIHLRVAHYGLPNLLKNNNNNNNTVNNLNKLDSVEHECNNEDLHLTCNICNKSFLKEQQLAVHLKTHDNKQWECDVCSKMFTTKYFLKKHKRLHTGEMPYHCTQCNKAFTFQQSYHKHMLYHSTEKPHSCGQCGRAFKELSTLHNHERIHSGERPFSCETCGKSFRQRVSCLVHRRIHTGAMPYHCTACGKKFRYKVSQRTHKCPSQPPGIVVRTETGDFLQKILETTYNKKNNLRSPISPKVSSPISSKVSSPISVNFEQINNLPATVSPESPTIPNQYKSVSPTISTTALTSNISNQQFVNMGAEIITDTNSEITDKHLEVIKNTDFFSLVLSPMDVSSPSEKLQNLCLSSSPQPSTPNSTTNHRGIDDEKTTINSSISEMSDKHEITFDSICTNTINNNQFTTNNENLQNDPLQTINEESLKQLLYGTSNVTSC